MRVIIYVSASGNEVYWDGPKLAVKFDHTELPPNPAGKDWLFFIATTSDDELLADRSFDIIEAFGQEDYFIFD